MREREADRDKEEKDGVILETGTAVKSLDSNAVTVIGLVLSPVGICHCGESSR